MPASATELDLNLLVVLDALLTERSVTQAGRLVGLSQPATSAALGRLRRFFDDPLLVRVGRRMELTRVATELQEPVRDILRRIEQTIEGRREFDPLTSNRAFTIALSDYALVVLGPVLHSAVTAEAPRVGLRFAPIELASPQTAPTYADLFVLPAEYARGTAEEIFRDRWVFVADKDHPGIGTRLTMSSLRGLPLIRYGAGDMGGVADRHLDSVGFQGTAVVTVSSFAAALLLVAGTAMVTLCQERLVHRARMAEHLRVLEPPFKIPDLVEVMAWAPPAENDPAQSWLRDIVRRVAADI